jgi:aminoglycoside phosphotransferase (APT) family kinase protein
MQMTVRRDARRRDEVAFARLAGAIRPGARLAELTPLHGGVTALITAMEIVGADGVRERVVVRQHGERDRAWNGNVALNEYRLLQMLAEAGFPAPEPVFVDPDGAFFPTPVIVIGYIDGTPDLALDRFPDSVQQMADVLARLHAVDLAEHELDSLPAIRDTLRRLLFDVPERRGMAPDEQRVREAMLAAWPTIAARPPALLHGDFWPGNLLWNDDGLAGVIDWEDAALGDPLFDLAAVRLELHWARDADAVAAFTERYLARAGLDEPEDLPFWDLSAALDPILNLHTWGHPPETEAIMRRRLVGFIDDAIARIARKGRHVPV